MDDFTHKKPYSQVIKGNLTKINPFLLFFQIDKKVRIYIDLTNPSPKFPSKGEVEIINPIKINGRTAVIGPKTKCNWIDILRLDDTKIELLNVLKANNIDEDELIAMDFILRQLEPFFPENMLPKCLIMLVNIAPLVTKGPPGPTLGYKRSLKNCRIKLPSDLNYVNDTSDLYSFMKFDGMCSYNVYPNRCLQNVTDSCTEYLFGILDVDQTCGYFTLSNKTSRILVKFYNTIKDLYIFKHTLVMLKKWTIFTEIFQDKKASSLKYIMVHVDDVIIIESMVASNPERLFYRKNELWDTGQRKTKFLQIIRKSEIIYGYSKRPECWIEAFILGSSDSSEQFVYLILTDNHISIIPFLTEHVVYQIFYNEEPKYLNIDSYKELNQIRKSKDLHRLGEHTIFQESDRTPIPQKQLVLENFQDVEKLIKTASQNQMFSFCLKIFKKELQDNRRFASWISKRHENVLNFGTPGKNMQMRLTFWNSVSNSYIDFYLNDRDNHITPLGLVEDMKVKIKHVQIYRNKYIKTNVFSSFEVLEYCPEIMFSSVNLCFSDRSTWHWRNKTPKTLFGMFASLPQRCIVHGSFLFQAIFDLKITPVCKSCKKPSVAELPCNICDTSDRDLNIDMSIGVQDPVNPSFYMTTENKYFLFELIGLKSFVEIKRFCNSFLNIGVVNVNFCDLEEFRMCYKDAESQVFLNQLLKTIRTHINFNLYPVIDAVCIKQNVTRSKPWKMIEFVFL